MKKIIVILAIFVLTASALLCFVGCDKEEQKPVATSYISLEINPSIRLVLDQNQKIMSYSAENDDACVLLYGETIVGKDVGTASQSIVDLAIKMGYVTEDNSAIAVEVTSDDSAVEQEILDKIEDAVEVAGDGADFEIKYDKEGSFLLNYELEKLKERHPDDENYQNLTAGRLRLINSAKAVDFSLTMDEAVGMTTQELLEIVGEAYDNMESFSTKAFKAAKLAAEQTYQATVVSAQETVYLAKYIEYKGVIEGGIAVVQYGGLSVAAKTIELIAKGVTLAQNTTDKILANDDVIDIAAKLGVNVDILKNEQGNVTVDSIGAYIDRVAKNSFDNMTQQMRDNLNSAVERLETSKEQFDDKPLSQEIADKIQSLLESIKIYDINPIHFTVEDLKDVAVYVKEKAESVKTKMDSSLSDDQKQSIEEAQQNAVSKLDSARTQYNQALAKAEQEARSNLQRIKTSRLDSLAQERV